MHCAEQFLELKICISPQFRAIDPPNPAGGFIQQNENARFATAACMQKYGNVRFATVACAKCMRYGGRGGGPYHGGGGGGGWQHGTRNHIYMLFHILSPIPGIKGECGTILGLKHPMRCAWKSYMDHPMIYTFKKGEIKYILPTSSPSTPSNTSYQAHLFVGQPR